MRSRILCEKLPCDLPAAVFRVTGKMVQICPPFLFQCRMIQISPPPQTSCFKVKQHKYVLVLYVLVLLYGTVHKTLLGGAGFLIFSGKIWAPLQGLAESGYLPPTYMYIHFLITPLYMCSMALFELFQFFA